MPKRKPTYDKNKKMSTLCKIFAFLLCFAVTIAHISFKNEENFDDIHFLTSSTDKQLPWSEGTLRSRLKKRSTTGGGDKPKLSVYSFSDANHNQAVLHWSGVPGSQVKLLLYTLICGTSVVKIRHVGVSLSMRSCQLYDVKMTTSHAVDCFKLSFFGKNTISRNKLFHFIQNKNN